MSTPDEAIEAALPFVESFMNRRGFELKGKEADVLIGYVCEAVKPILLSHEREQTRLAHLDAIVNRDTADRLEQELETAKVAAWEEGKDAVWSYLSNQDPRRERPTNPYRSE